MERAFVDTSAWFAYANRHDPDHTRIRSVLRTFQGCLITSNFIFDETVTLCLYRLGYQVAARVGEVLLDQAVVDLVRITPKMNREPGRCGLHGPTRRTAIQIVPRLW